MKILNPTYDTVFKYLLEDVEIAKGLISRIIDQEIVDITPLPQEQTNIEVDLKYLTIPLHRQDFVVAVKYTDENGKEKINKIMVEMQKSPFAPEVSRFRQYISDKYHHKTKLADKDEAKDLPIKTIYLIEKTFNKKLPAILHVKNDYYDRLTGKKYTGEHDEFVDLLVHEAYFIQTQELPSDIKNDLIRVLSIFSPKYQIKLGKEEKRFIDVDEKELNRYKDKLINLIIRRLDLGKNNNKLLTALNVEIDYETKWEQLEAERDMARIREAEAIRIAEEARKEEEQAKQKAEQERKEKELAKQKVEQERKEKELAKQKAEEARKKEEQAKQKAEEARKREEQAKQKEKEAMIKLAKKMKKYGESIDEISKDTGLSREEIEDL